MVMIRSLFALLLATAVLAYDDGPRRLLGRECPTDVAFSSECLSAAMPPYPICMKRSASEWVEHAIESHARCCGTDTTECKCPQKNSARFLGKIENHCHGVEICKAQVLGGLDESIETERLEIDEEEGH
ncbi:expressed unknown protein [Seminavis robusta]|uniref:Uncharacterized protein n=1 Tax=Seminavis robusta TaxID=568900 RepID=A0A9N8F494_9STRA|nr:expressed unknown protein [Seminavis robusta]|eukprot:Sro3326_g346830.1 n/a (129) ;mRNA; f:3703-4089